MIKYFVKNIETGETKEVEPYIHGDTVEDANLTADTVFVPVELDTVNLKTDDALAGEHYTFENADNTGAFVNNDIVQLDLTGKWDIFKAEINEEETTPVAEESSVE